MILPSPIPAITLWQPWAWALFGCGKDLENRPRNLGVTGWVAIHAGMHWDDRQVLDDIADCLMASEKGVLPSVSLGTVATALRSQLGHVLGVVNIENWARRETLREGRSPWLAYGPGYAGLVRGAVALRVPVLCREGFHRGVWKLPPSVEHAVRSQLVQSSQQ